MSGNITASADPSITIDVKLGKTERFAYYDPEINAFIVEGSMVREGNLGMWKVEVEVTYNDPRGWT